MKELGEAHKDNAFRKSAFLRRAGGWRGTLMPEKAPISQLITPELILYF